MLYRRAGCGVLALHSFPSSADRGVRSRLSRRSHSQEVTISETTFWWPWGVSRISDGSNRRHPLRSLGKHAILSLPPPHHHTRSHLRWSRVPPDQRWE